MNTLWRDGSASIQEIADAADSRGYEYIAITDHSKGLKIAGGINEEQLRQRTHEIAAVNQSLGAARKTMRVLRSIEVNLNAAGEVDMEVSSLDELDLVLGRFHSPFERRTTRPTATWLRCAIPRSRYWVTRAGVFITSGWD